MVFVSHLVARAQMDTKTKQELGIRRFLRPLRGAPWLFFDQRRHAASIGNARRSVSRTIGAWLRIIYLNACLAALFLVAATHAQRSGAKCR